MQHLIVTIFTVAAFAAAAYAQPPVAWFHTYHNDRYDSFLDIYPPAGGGYVMCGCAHPNNVNSDTSANMWVVRIGDDGNLTWSRTYGANNDYDEGITIVEVDGGFLVGGYSGGYPNNYQIAAWRIAENGEQIWFRTYGRGWCKAVIKLKSGEFLLTGRTGGGRLLGFLICINGDGRLLWERYYEIDGSFSFSGMRETDGGVILAGTADIFNPVYSVYLIWVVKVSIDNEGEVVWSQTHRPYFSQTPYSIVRAHNEGFVLAGACREGPGGTLNYIAFKIDDEGNQDWNRLYNFENLANVGSCTCIERLPDDGYAIVGTLGLPNDYGRVVRITSNGVPRWQRI
ncbi:MAG: hypothetical protein V2A61_07585 [Calditrichota bacterium]